MQQAESRPLYDALAGILRDVAGDLVVCADDAEQLYIDTDFIMKNGKPLFFGKVAIAKRYISYHLMPVYVEPALLDDISSALRRRMQGKSCFHFRERDDALFRELRALTQAGRSHYEQAGYI